MQAATLAERLASRDRQRFVGREAELGLFDRLLVDEPDRSVVLVHGQGGIGKSALVREVARRGNERGFSVRWVDCRDLAPVPGEIERALAGIDGDQHPLVIFDTYERMSAADAWVRTKLVPSLPARALVVLSGRSAPAHGWFNDGWEQLVCEIELHPLEASDAMALAIAHGLADEEAAAEIIDWADGLPLALALGADAARDGTGAWRAGTGPNQNLTRSIIRRIARTELDGGNLDVADLAAVARCVDARMLRDVLPSIDPDEAETWLRSRTFTEPVGSGVALHDVVRRAMHDDLRARNPERERDLRRRIADHLHLRALRGEPRLLVDLAELVDNADVRWGLGAEGSVDYRPDLVRETDGAEGAPVYAPLHGGPTQWQGVVRWLAEAPDHVVTVRDADDRLAGLAVYVTPQTAPPLAEEDAIIGPWLAHARTHHAGEDVLIWRESADFVGRGRLTSPVLAILNTAVILRSGLTNPRRSYVPIDPDNSAAMRFAEAVDAVHVPELDWSADGKRVWCHVIDHGAGGMLGAFRDTIYAELGVAAQPVDRDEPAEQPLTVQVVRDALRCLDSPLELAASPLATGETVRERAASVRAAIETAVAGAFGTSADEQLLRSVVVRGYLDPAASHELAADELHVSRATYFRRLRTASQRVADWLIAERR